MNERRKTTCPTLHHLRCGRHGDYVCKINDSRVRHRRAKQSSMRAIGVLARVEQRGTPAKETGAPCPEVAQHDFPALKGWVI